ncbi:MAG: hypothetical protein ACJ76Y_08875 [Thermoanaerobaculia bacterium]
MTWKTCLLLGVVIVPLALATRWGGNAELKGARFSPWPDTVEYAAEAQSLARSGQVYLQIGPYRVRPRFPPGWPLLLAPGVRLGMAGQELWRITGVLGALLAWLIGVAAAWATAALGPPSQTLTPGPSPDPSPLPHRERGEMQERIQGFSPSSPGEGGREGSGEEGRGDEGSGGRGGRGRAALLAGLLAGTLWALTPIAVDLGQTLMSDEPTALVCLLSLGLTGAAFLRRGTRGDWALALAGGLAFGLAATMRSIVAVLMLAPLAAFFLGAFRRKPVLPRLLAWGLGAAVFPAVTMLILARSGWPVWQWSGYGFWMPGRYERLTDTFGFRYAFQPDLTFRQEVDGRPLSHLELGLRVLLGIPGLRTHHYLGYLWPIAGWLAAIPLYRTARRRDPWTAGWLTLGLLLWTLGHLAVFSLYFYPSSRFYLAPLALCVTLFAAACGAALARPDLRARLAAGAAALLVAALTVQGFFTLQHEPSPKVETERTRARFAKWLAKGDEWRSRRTMPFDPVHAQALGLLTPEVAAQVHAWGELPETVHVRRLRANGYLAAHTLESPGR